MNMEHPWNLPGNLTQRLEAYLLICSCFIVKDRDEDATGSSETVQLWRVNKHYDISH